MDETTARIKLGPNGTAVLPKGRYDGWLTVTGAAERPVRPVVDLKVT